MITEDDNGKEMCVCDVCGHKWYPRRNKVPYKCPQLDCQSSRWDDDSMVLTQLDQLSLLKELERRNKNEYGNKGDEYGMGDIDDKVDIRVKKALREVALNKEIEEMREELVLLKKSNKMEECPGCHKHALTHGAKFCPDCGEEMDWSE